MKTVIEMARDQGLPETATEGVFLVNKEDLGRFAELVRADEREKYKWDVHSCGPTCKRYACVAMREAVEAEREACAMVCEDLPAPERMSLDSESFYECVTLDCADAIRARGATHDL